MSALRDVLDGTDPDRVLVRVRNGDAVSLATRKDYGRPIDYLRYRSKNPISDAEFMAAEFYAGDYHAISQTGSNTAATIEHLMKAVPFTAEDRRMLANEGVNSQRMHPKAESKEAKDPSEKMLGAALAKKRVDAHLDNVQRAILSDLVLREYSIGTIATRWRWQPEAAAMMVRYSLARLTQVYENLREDFASAVREMRTNEMAESLT